MMRHTGWICRKHLTHTHVGIYILNLKVLRLKSLFLNIDKNNGNRLDEKTTKKVFFNSQVKKRPYIRTKEHYLTSPYRLVIGSSAM